MRHGAKPIKPMLLLLGGPSCGGKSSIARVLREMLPAGDCEIAALDRYYRDLSHLAPHERARENFDHPDAIDWPLVKDNIASLIAGHRVNAPTYDFANHSRGNETAVISPARVLILEGILALCDSNLNAIASLRAFVELTDAACLVRRIQRDTSERGRSVESVREQFAATVQPMAERYVRPSRIVADLVLDGQDPPERSARQILERIQAH